MRRRATAVARRPERLRTRSAVSSASSSSAVSPRSRSLEGRDVKTPVDDRLRREARDFELRYACEHCVHFEPAHGACAEGYPNEAHRDVSLEGRRVLVFCKSFELS